MAREVKVADIPHLQNYTIDEFAALRRVSRSTVYREIADLDWIRSRERGARVRAGMAPKPRSWAQCFRRRRV